MLCDFAFENNMVIMSTHFQSKQIHKTAWISPYQTTINQTDLVLVNDNKK